MKDTPDNLVHNPAVRLTDWCKDIDDWPQSWSGDADDVPVGFKLLDEFKRYLANLIAKHRSKATVKKHANYLWCLGGEIIRDTSEHGMDDKLSNKDLVLRYVDSVGGPYWRHAHSESDRIHYHSVCRQLYKFLTQ